MVAAKHIISCGSSFARWACLSLVGFLATTPLPASGSTWPRKLAIVDSRGLREVPGLGGLTAVVTRESWTSSLGVNGIHVPPSPLDRTFVARLSGATWILTTPDSGRWTLWSMEPGGMAVAEFQGNALCTLEPPPQSTGPLAPVAVSEWLSKCVGFHGVVIAKERGLIQVLSFVDPGRQGLQAIVVEHSHTSESLQGITRKGSALLGLRSFDRNTREADFALVAGDGARIPIGAKVILESHDARSLGPKNRE